MLRRMLNWAAMVRGRKSSSCRLGASRRRGHFTKALTLEPLEQRALLAVTLAADAAGPGGDLKYLLASKDLNDIAESINGNYLMTNVAGNAHAFDVIPRFSQWYNGAAGVEQFVAQTSGAWESGATWNRGGRIPSATSVVIIPGGTNVTFRSDISAMILEIGDPRGTGGTLVFDSQNASPADPTVTLSVETLTVLPGGLLDVTDDPATRPAVAGVSVEIVIANNNWDLTRDPQQYGHGLLVFGDLTLQGESHAATWTALSKDALRNERLLYLEPIPAGVSSTAYLAQHYAHWNPGDQVVLPDTRAYRLTGDPDRQPQWRDPRFPAGSTWGVQTEVGTISLVTQAVNPRDGKLHAALSLKDKLKYDHRGLTSTVDPTASFFADVGLLSSNVTVRSANPEPNPRVIRTYDPTGVSHRGHVLIGGRGNVHISDAAFEDLGRTDAVIRDYYRSDGYVDDAYSALDGLQHPRVEYRQTSSGALVRKDLTYGGYSGRSLSDQNDPIRATNNVRVKVEVSVDPLTGVPTAAKVTRVDVAGIPLPAGQVQTDFRGSKDRIATVSNFEINQIGRYAVHFHHFVGPARDAAYDGRQFWFTNNVVAHSLKWALALHDTNFGDVSGNVIFDAQGAGIVGETGAEVDNLISGNLIVQVRGVSGVPRGGTTQNLGQEDIGREGVGIWMRRTGNLIEGNVIADASYAALEFNSYFREGEFSTVRPWLPRVVPGTVHRYRGVDPVEALVLFGQPLGGRQLLRQQVWESPRPYGRFTLTHFEQLPNNPEGTIINNQAYGMSDRALWAVEINGAASGDPLDTVHFKNLTVWNIWRTALMMYHNSAIVLDNLRIINDPLPVSGLANSGWTTNGGVQPLGVYFGDQYASAGAVVIHGGIIEGMAIGFYTPTGGDSSTYDPRTWKPVLDRTDPQLGPTIRGGITIRDTKMKNWENVWVRPLRDQRYGNMTVWLDNVQFYDGRFGGDVNPIASQPIYPGQKPRTGTTNQYDFLQSHINLDAGSDRDDFTQNVQVLVTNYQAYDSSGHSTVPSGQVRDFQVFSWAQDPKMSILATPTANSPASTMPQSSANALTANLAYSGGKVGRAPSAGSTSAAAIWQRSKLAPLGQWSPEPGSSTRLSDANYKKSKNWTAKIIGIRATFPGFGVGLGGDGSWTTVPAVDRLAIVTPWDAAQLRGPSATILLRYQLHGGLGANERIAYQLNGLSIWSFRRTITVNRPGANVLRLFIQQQIAPGVWIEVPGTAKQVSFSLV